jgi:hypothetical protein
MKKLSLYTFLVLMWCNVALASEFCDGFKKGYKTGYKVAHNTNFDPFPPYCPYKPYKKIGDPQSDYEHGYILGYKKGFGS